MNFREFISLIEEKSPDLLNENGEVFFGSKASLRESNKIALVGLNPGGNGLPSIRENLERYDSDTSKNHFSGYLDQCWHDPYFSRYECCPRCQKSLQETGVVHQDRHQKMVSSIANFLGFNLRNTIALNAIWTQTKSAAYLKTLLKNNGNPKMEDFFKTKTFPIISEVFDRCGVRLVICLGNGANESSFNFFRSTLNIDRSDVVCVSNNYRDGRFFFHKTQEKLMLYFGIPHPSLHTLSNIGLQRLMELSKEIMPAGAKN